MFYKSKYKRLLEKYKKQEDILKRYVSAENDMNETHKYLNELVEELERTKEQWAREIIALKAERKKYSETIRQLIKLKKMIFYETEKRG